MSFSILIIKAVKYDSSELIKPYYSTQKNISEFKNESIQDFIDNYIDLLDMKYSPVLSELIIEV